MEGLYFLNHSSSFIWKQHQLGIPPEQIASSFSEAFDVSLEIARSDVSACLETWAQIPVPKAVSYSLNGTPFRVHFTTPELEAEIHPRLAHLLSPQVPPAFTLTPSRLPNVTSARALLLQEVTRRIHDCEWLALLHAGACGTESACVVFPACSHSGKTTLAAGLIHAGLTFYADDSVGIVADTMAIPAMPFALAVREGSWPLFPALDNLPAVERFGQQVRFWPPPVHAGKAQAAAIVFSLYEPGAELSIEPLNTMQALLLLKDAGFWVDPDRIEPFLAWLGALPAYRMTYSQVDDALPFISRLLASNQTSR